MKILLGQDHLLLLCRMPISKPILHHPVASDRRINPYRWRSSLSMECLYRVGLYHTLTAVLRSNLVGAFGWGRWGNDGGKDWANSGVDPLSLEVVGDMGKRNS